MRVRSEDVNARREEEVGEAGEKRDEGTIRT